MTSPVLRPDDRLVVLGASGWFGTTLLRMCRGQIPILAVARTKDPGFMPYDADVVARFRPTVVANFAFLTREKVEQYGVDEYMMQNRTLTSRLLHVTTLPDVRLALTVSSGAALTEPETPYGRLKAEEEESFLTLSASSRAVVVLRAYSVSGPHVTRPRDYAFSDLILQAGTGCLTVRARRPTFRRYVDAGDAIRVALRAAEGGGARVIDTGGELIEVGDLARRVAQVLNPTAQVTRAPLDSDEAEIYASDNATWAAACEATGYTPMTLNQQIAFTSSGIVGAHSAPSTT